MGAYLVAMAAWLGGLVALAVLLVPRNRPAGLDRVWTRFSWFTGLSVLAMAITGAAQHLLARGTATSRSTVLLLVELPMLVAMALLSRYAVAYGKRVAFRERYLPGFAVEGSGQLPKLRGTIGLQLILSVAMVGMAVAQLVVLPVPGRPGAPPLGDPVPDNSGSHRRATPVRRPAICRGSSRTGSACRAAHLPPSFPSRRLAASWWFRRVAALSAGGTGALTWAIRTGRP